jgi:hypothetical protein
VGDRHQGHVVVPALPGAALEVVKPERVLQLTVIMLHPVGCVKSDVASELPVRSTMAR